MFKFKLPRTEATRNVLAWGAFVLAIVGGVTATASWVGAPVIFVVGIFWWWVPFVLAVVVGLMVVGDVLVDGIRRCPVHARSSRTGPRSTGRWCGRRWWRRFRAG